MTALDIAATPRLRTRRGIFSLALFSTTIFLSAALLFCLEPMFSKMVLPVLGGTAAVWSVAMVVFQGLLLAGYLYAHLLTRYLSLTRAALVHVAVLVIAMISLPIAIAGGFAAPPETGVSFWLIVLFLASVGLPCFALSANAPLLQAWYARSDPGQATNAYLLYGASNFGSFAILLAYPFLIEPFFGLSQQSHLWSAFYIALVLAIAGCGAFALRAPKKFAATPALSARIAIVWRDKLAWATLGFIPSGLLVAVTAHIATDVASAPLLWIVPLALYLLSFVFAFSDRPLLSSGAMLAAQPFTAALLIILLLWTGEINWGLTLFGHLAAFFVTAMVCQSELYRRRPAPAELTQFYVWMSLGGVMGGSFAALIAPQIFTTVLEYPLLAFGALLVRPDIWMTPRAVWLKDTAFVVFIAVLLSAAFFVSDARVAVFALAVMALAGVMAFQGRHPARLVGIAALLLVATSLYDPSQSIVYRARSFYGVYKAVDVENGKFRVLYHGTTAHGAEQLRDDKGRVLTTAPDPLTYYYRGGPFAEALRAVRAANGNRLSRVALVGLGVGALSCYAKPDEAWTFYELDPLIVDIASDTNLFRTVSTCAPHVATVIGDGRLTLRDARPGIDLLILDIFSSDSVPVHMLTSEAFALYRSRLAAHGAIAFNISNKNMALADVVAASAAANAMITAVRRDTTPPAATLHLKAEIAVVTSSLADMKALKLGPGWRIVTPKVRAWTDDYSDIIGAILRKMRE